MNIEKHHWKFVYYLLTKIYDDFYLNVCFFSVSRRPCLAISALVWKKNHMICINLCDIQKYVGEMNITIINSSRANNKIPKR